MKIYYIGMYENPTVDRLAAITSVEFAHFSSMGTWAYRQEPCKKCDYYWQELVPPLLVQWEPSSERIGDFSWDGPFGFTFVVRKNVADAFVSLGLECRFAPVVVVRPERKRNTVRFPYNGPELFWGQCSATVDLDMEASGVFRESSCPACGDTRYTFRNSGIVIRRKDWDQQHMFQISTNGPACVFVTAVGRRKIEEAGFLNIAFTEAGQIVE